MQRNKRQVIAEILSIAAMILLLTYIADAAVGKGKTGFLPMDEVQRGMFFGGSSIALFFASFGVGIKIKSKLTTVLLIAGGAITGTSVLAATYMSEGGLTEIPSSFLRVIIIGYVILGLGILRAVKKY